MRTGSFFRWWYGSATMMLLTSNLGSALQPHSPFKDHGLDVHRNLQDCSLCGTETFTDGGETSCVVCISDDPYGVFDVCTPCGSVSMSELQDFYTDLCGPLSDITAYTVENCWSYLVPTCPESSDEYESPEEESSDEYVYESPEDSSDDYVYESPEDSSDDYIYTAPDPTTDDDSIQLEQGSNNNSSSCRVCASRSMSACLVLAMFTVLLSTWMR